MKNKLFTLYILFSTILLFAQNEKYYVIGGDTIKKRPKLSIGSRHSGIGFGNNLRYDGIRASVIDHDSLDNGISLSITQPLNGYKKINGLDVSLLYTAIDGINGLSISPLWLNVEKGNGMTVSGIMSDVSMMNGVHITGGVTLSMDYINGICFTGIANVVFKVNGVLIGGCYNVVDSTLNGIGISGLFQKTEIFSGLSIAPLNITSSGKGMQIGLFNKAQNLCGIQIGLININKRKKHFKIFPFINFSFKQLKNIDTAK